LSFQQFNSNTEKEQENTMNVESATIRRRGTVLAVALALVAGGAIGALGMSEHARQQQGTAHITLASSPDPARVANSISFANGFAPIVKASLPEVVNISSTKVIKNRGQQQNPFMNDPFFQQFFGQDGGRQFQQQQPREQKEYALGSGVIVSPEGYILTNNHVVDGASDVTVDLSDKRHFTAKVVGTDDRTDIAVLKIDAPGLTAMPLGHSSALEVGDFVLAIGNPFGVGESVSMGIVSALGRSSLGIEGRNSYENFIQTDAAINHGNSGGALVDIHGELVGINTAILTGGSEMGGGGEGSAGVGFAVPIDLVRSVMMQIVEHGKVVRAEIGAHIQPVTPQLAKQFGLPKAEGAIIVDMIPNGPAEKAGLKQGDIILGMDGQEYADSSSLRLHIAESAPGTTSKLQIVRDGKPMEVTITLDTLKDVEQPGDQEGNDNDNGKGESSQGIMSGVSVETLTPQLTHELNLTKVASGVVIEQVSPDSAAADAGLQRGLVITEVNHHPVHNVQEYKDALSHAGKGSVLLVVVSPNSDGVPAYVVVGGSQ
jgi:serine protease Do